MSKIFIVILFLMAAGAIIYYHSQKTADVAEFYASPKPDFGYEDCLKSKGSKVFDGYLKKCQTSDLVSYYEPSDSLSDTSKWKTIDTGLGYSFFCPDQWTCNKLNDNSYALYNPNFGISAFQFNLITPENFQQSGLRHPDFKTPIDWYSAVKSKNKNAVKTSPITIKSVTGTDGLLYPDYAGYNLDQMRVREATEGGGLEFFKDESDANILIPLNNRDVILIIYSPWYLSDSPVFKTIISSIKSTTLN